MKYRVKYASVGLLSGYAVGATVEVQDPQDAGHLLGLGLIEPLSAVGPVVPEQPVPGTVLLPEELGSVLPPVDPRLATYSRGGNWYEFPGADPTTPLRVRGQAAALIELERRAAGQ